MFGGYSQSITINEKFVLTISHPADQLAAVPPLLRAGMITYSPLAGPGKKSGLSGSRIGSYGDEAHPCHGRPCRGPHDVRE